MNADKYQMGMICQVKIDLGITLWQAIKIRIAGKGYLPIAEKIGNEIVAHITTASTGQPDTPSAS
jgi:hypothetical protein